MALGIPEYLFASIYEITPEFFLSRGISFVFSDIDNTLATYDDPVPTPELLEWFESMNKAGIEFIFVSNNDNDRVSKFNSSLGFTYVCKAGKPLPGKIRKLMKAKRIEKLNTAMLGDQILTDSLAATFLGILSVNVPPIKDRTEPFFRFKRKIEVAFMRSYWKKHPDQQELKRLWYSKTGNKLKGSK